MIEVFEDDASGGLIDRPGIQSMLKFIRKRRKQKTAVIIDDISRLARDLNAHWTLRDAITRSNGVLLSPSVEFGEDSASVLLENILASVAQNHKQRNAEQTVDRSRARVGNGYVVMSRPPKGYVYNEHPLHEKILVRDEPIASIIAEALEGYASGRFQTQVEVKRFLESQPGYPKDLPNGTIRNQRVHDLLTQPIYAGMAHGYGISPRKGHHEGLISIETFERIQTRLAGNAKAPARKDISHDFPLRGFIVCDDCEKPMTSCWSKSKTGDKHPYYMCKTKGCESYRKSIRRAELEGDFESVLKGLHPQRSSLQLQRTSSSDSGTSD